jgi:hypothetical protein
MRFIDTRAFKVTVGAVAIALLPASAFGWGSMSDQLRTLYSLQTSGDGVRYLDNGDWAGMQGLGYHTTGSTCEDPDTFGEPGTDQGCYAEPFVDGEPGITLRHGWFHQLCSIDKTDPEIAAPANLVEEQTNRDGWTSIMNWLDRDPDANPDLIPIATDDIIPRPLVRVRAEGAIELTPAERALGGRIFRQVNEITFPLGLTTVHLLAIDCHGNTANDSFTVTVIDTTAPTFAFDIDEAFFEATSPFGTLVELPAAGFVVDICDAQPVVFNNLIDVCSGTEYVDPDTGDIIVVPPGRCELYDQDFNLDGDHIITMIVEDSSGNQSTFEVILHIIDTTPPEVALVEQEVVIEQELRCGTRLGDDRIPQALIGDLATPLALLRLQKFVNGNQGPVEIDNDFCFPLGSAVVSYVVTDLSGNFTLRDVTITVIDTTKPNVDFIGVPAPIWHSFPRLVTVATSDICDADLDISVEMQDEELLRDVDEYSAPYDSDNHWTVQFTVEDDSGNVTITAAESFGVDLTPPVATYEGISQDGVNSVDAKSYPAFFKGDRIDTLTSGTDDPGRTGHYSGWARVTGWIDQGTNSSHLLYNQGYGPLDNTFPPTGPRDIRNIRCTNDEVCELGEGGLFNPHALELGPHRLIIQKEDVAGNGEFHPVADQVGTQTYFFNVFDLKLALQQADGLLKDILDNPELSDACRDELEGTFVLDEDGERIPIAIGQSADIGWDQKDPEGVIDWIGFNPTAPNERNRNINAYQALKEWRRRQDSSGGTYWGDASHRIIGNVFLFLASSMKKLKFVNDNCVDTSVMLDNLTRGAIAEFTEYYDYAQDTVDPNDLEAATDLIDAFAFRNAAIQRHANGSYNQALIELLNALFFVEHSLFRLSIELSSEDPVVRTESNEALARRMSGAFNTYCHDDAYWNGQEEMCILWDIAKRSRGFCANEQFIMTQGLLDWCHDRKNIRFPVDEFGDISRDDGGGFFLFVRDTNPRGLLLSEITWVHVLLEFVDYVGSFDRAQSDHVWTRWWEWELSHLIRELVRFSRDAACRMQLHGNPIFPDPLCPNFSGHELLDQARCEFYTGIRAFNNREVDEALRTYAGAECLMRRTFSEVYNTLVDVDVDGIVPDCKPADSDEVVPCQGDEDNCVCDFEAGQIEYRRYMPERYPQLQYPDFPRCPPRDRLLVHAVEDAQEDLLPVGDPDGVPDWFECDGERWCWDGREAALTPDGACAPEVAP